jgi:hypothetical protein
MEKLPILAWGKIGKATGSTIAIRKHVVLEAGRKHNRSQAPCTAVEEFEKWQVEGQYTIQDSIGATPHLE